MIFHFKNNTFLEKPMGSCIVGLQRSGIRPKSVELDYFDFETLFSNKNTRDKYLVKLWASLAPDKRIQSVCK